MGVAESRQRPPLCARPRASSPPRKHTSLRCRWSPPCRPGRRLGYSRRWRPMLFTRRSTSSARRLSGRRRRRRSRPSTGHGGSPCRRRSFPVDPSAPAWEALLDAAHRVAADVLACGTRGRGAFARALLGSTSSRLLHHTDVPLLVVPDRCGTLDGPVAAAYDGSQGATRAIQVAGRLLGGRPTVVAHAWEPPGSPQARGSCRRRRTDRRPSCHPQRSPRSARRPRGRHDSRRSSRRARRGPQTRSARQSSRTRAHGEPWPPPRERMARRSSPPARA
jgi:hypothetical protein